MADTNDNIFIFTYIEPEINILYPNGDGRIDKFADANAEWGDHPLRKYFKTFYYTMGSRYIQFENVNAVMKPDKDFTYDFWFMTYDNSWSRIFTWNNRWENWNFGWSTNQGGHNLIPSIGNTSLAYDRGKWQHFAFTYDSENHIARAFVNGVCRNTATNYTLNYDASLAFMGRSLFGADPLTDIGYTGIRIKNECIFKENFDYTKLSSFSYISTVYNDLTIIDLD